MIRCIPPAVLLAAALLSFAASAQTVTRLVVPAPPGGPMDSLARLVAPDLARELDHSVIVENTAGAQGAVGADAVARSPADGRTLLVAAPFLASNLAAGKSSFDPQRDLAPVALLTHSFLYLVAHESSGIRTVEDLRRVAGSRAKPLSCGAGPGSMTVACEVLRTKVGGNSITVPYPGVAPAAVAVLGGHVDVAFLAGSAIASVNHPSARIVAGLGNSRPDKPLDNLPLLVHTWPDWSTQTFYGVFAPAGTPADRVQQLNASFNRVMASPRVVEAIARMGDRVVTGPPERLASQLAAEIEYYRKMAAQTGSQ